MGFWASLPRPPLGYCTLVALAVEVAVSVVVVAALPFVNLFLTSSVSSSATLAILQSAISCCYFFCFLVSLHFVAVALDSCSMPFPLLLLSLLLMACLFSWTQWAILLVWSLSCADLTGYTYLKLNGSCLENSMRSPQYSSKHFGSSCFQEVNSQ